MNREVINPQELPAVNSTYSQAIKANGMIFVAGQIGLDPATGKLISSDIAEQARQAIENTAVILKAAGSSLANVVSTTLYLTEFDQAKAQVHAGAVMSGMARQDPPETLGRACELTFVLQGYAKSDQGVRVARHDRENARELNLRARRVGAINVNGSQGQR